MDKVRASALDAIRLAAIGDGATIAAGGFGLCGIPELAIAALREAGPKNLTFVSNNCGVDDFGLGILLQAKQIKKMISSYVGENKEFERQFLSGELEVELTPQGTLAERLRAGGAGIAGFYTETGVGTVIADGGLPLRYTSGGEIDLETEPKETRRFTVEGEHHMFVLEHGIQADFGLLHAAVGDRHGNLRFNKSARNFNPLCAMAGRVAIAEVERLVEPGELDPDDVHLPGVYVQRVVVLTPDQVAAKRIEKRTVRPRPAGAAG